MSRVIGALAVVAVLAIMLAPFAMSTPEMAKKENKRCIYCHTAVGKSDLNDAGKYYKQHGTLEGYERKKP